MDKRFSILILFLIFLFLGFSGEVAGCDNPPVTRSAALAILQQFPPTNQGIQNALPGLQQSFGSQVRILDHPIRLDKIDFGHGLVVDVIEGSGGPNPSWGWIVESPCGDGPPPPPPEIPPAKDFGGLIENIFTWALWLVGAAIFVNFLWAGLLWFTAAGRTGPIGQAKEKMTNALIGAIILLASYLILNTINPDLVKQTFILPGL